MSKQTEKQEIPAGTDKVDQSELIEALSANCYKLEDVETLIAAARKIRHWHDCMLNRETNETEGMVVSAAAVRELWNALKPFGT